MDDRYIYIDCYVRFLKRYFFFCVCFHRRVSLATLIKEKNSDNNSKTSN